MDNIRNSLSGLKKNLKHRLGARKHKPDGRGENTSGERLGLLSLPESASGHDGEGKGASTDEPQVRLRDQSPQPVPMQGGESGDVRLMEADVKIVADGGGGLSREEERIYPFPPIPSIPPSGEPGSM